MAIYNFIQKHKKVIVLGSAFQNNYKIYTNDSGSKILESVIIGLPTRAQIQINIVFGNPDQGGHA